VSAGRESLHSSLLSHRIVSICSLINATLTVATSASLHCYTHHCYAHHCYTPIIATPIIIDTLIIAMFTALHSSLLLSSSHRCYTCTRSSCVVFGIARSSMPPMAWSRPWLHRPPPITKSSENRRMIRRALHIVGSPDKLTQLTLSRPGSWRLASA
jgi:hypothetical protein